MAPLPRKLVVLAQIVSAAYILAGVVGAVWPGHWDDSSPASDQILWVVFLVGGGLLIFAGLRVFPRSPWAGAALVSLGAIAGALALFWTIIVLLAAAALVVMSIVAARGMTASLQVRD